MLTPYQCIQKCGNILIAASISRLDSFNLEDGSQLSSWTFPVSRGKSSGIYAARDINGKPAAPDTDASPANVEQASKRPTKRRRTSNDVNDKDAVQEYADIQVDTHSNCFTVLKSTTDGSHVIAVVGEDKSINVFEHNGRGKLQHLSQR
jgi:tRNA (guanine-N(7)-)-methyltransferase subunit TRM82